MKEFTIKELAAHLQKKIDGKLKYFNEHYDTVHSKYREIAELEEKMSGIINELEPVQSLIYNQNPHLEKVFESIKRVYITEDNSNVSNPNV